MTNIENFKSSCPVCETINAGRRSEEFSDRRKGLPGIWRLVDCLKCGAIYMDPMPSDAELQGYYDAYLKEGELVLSVGLGSRRPKLRQVYHAVSGDVDPRDFVEIPSGGRVLDYGSGDGNYLSYFHSKGVNIVGAEISDKLIAASEEAGLSMTRVDDFDRIPFPDGQFDVVYLMQVFEHLRSPRRFMQELSRVLKPGGRLYLAVPNAASAWRRVFARNWVSGWFAPFHLVHYTRDSLAGLGREYGLPAVDSWSRTPESWFRLNVKAALYRKDNKVENPRLFPDALPFKLPLMLLLRIVDLLVRERDCIVVEFSKR